MVGLKRGGTLFQMVGRLSFFFVFQAAQCIESGHVTKQNLPSVWHMCLDCRHEFLGLGLKVDTL